jgi:hypothetical protein
MDNTASRTTVATIRGLFVWNDQDPAALRHHQLLCNTLGPGGNGPAGVCG